MSQAAVSLMTGEATVAFDPARTAPAALVDAIVETGYEAKLPEAGRSEFELQQERERMQAAEARELGVKAVVSLILGGIAMGLSMHSMADPAVRYVLFAIAAFVMVWAGGGSNNNGTSR